MNCKPLRILGGVGVAALLFSIGCAGGGSSSSSTSGGNASTTGVVQAVISDDATEDWATIGIKVLSISLVPQNGGTPVVVYTAPSTVPVINLVQLDQLGEIIGNASIPTGTYTSATLTLSANPGDVTLVSSADPDLVFPLKPGTVVPSSNIQIKGTSGSAGSLTVPLTISLVKPLTVTADSTNALDLEFDLKHPAFIVEHFPATSSAPIWAINFNGPVRHHPRFDLTRLVLRHTLGQVTAVSSDNSAITIAKDFATYPVPASGEVPIAGGINLNILADATNGTEFYDVDAQTKTTIKDFSTVGASLLNNGSGKYVRIAARYQAGGTLVAVRIWASTSFEKIWLSPEGHVVHVDTANNVMSVTNENGQAVPINIGSQTQFFFRTPQTALADATPIGTGTSFFDGTTQGGLPNLARGFKVHVSAVDPLASTLTAQTVDIEIARYDGMVSGAGLSDFTYTRTFATAKDDYTGTLPYIAASAANGTDSAGNPITGFEWWYFTLPTMADTGANAIPDFVNVVNNAANFGGTVGQQNVWSVSYSNWGDGTTTHPTDWFARFAVIEPTPLPLGTVSSAAAAINNGIGFSMTVAGGTQPVLVDMSSVSGSATLVYQVDNSGGIVTVTQKDLTNPATLTAVQNALVSGKQVKAYGVPTGGAVAAYVVFYYTGTPSQQ